MSYALVAVSGAATAVVAVFGTTALATPAALRPPSEATSAVITMTEFRDERTVAAEVEAGQSLEAQLGISGTYVWPVISNVFTEPPPPEPSSRRTIGILYSFAICSACTSFS